MEFISPPIARDESRAWLSLGSQVAEWQEANLAFGPGDLLGQQLVLDVEDRALLERMYQVHPPQHEGRCRFVAGRCELGRICGRRRFDTAVIMLRKGSKKSERLAATCAAELAENAPVRCDGFRREGRLWVPVGRPVTSPFVYLFAFAKEQAEDTSWDAMRAMILDGPSADLFSVWEDRILRRDGSGEAKALASAPDSRDGGKTTFQGKEEGHRYTTPRHREAHQTTRANLSKRPLAEPWEMHATTMYEPGEASVIEDLHDAARKLTGEQAKASRMFFFYRWADDKIQIRHEDGTLDDVGVRAAIADASGPTIAAWSDIDGIASLQFTGAGADVNYAERVWLNRGRRGASQAFDVAKFKELGEPPRTIARARVVDEAVLPGGFVVLSWHGARYADAAALVATEIETGVQNIVNAWERPENAGEDWEVPEDEAQAAVDEAFAELEVWRFYVNPTGWESSAAHWAAQYGDDVVVSWRTNAWTEMTRGVKAYSSAILAGEVHHDGDVRLVAAVGAARRRYLTHLKDDDGKPLWVISKERPDSPHPVNVAQAAIIGWVARLDALKAGATEAIVLTAV